MRYRDMWKLVPVEESTGTDPIINLDSADEEILLKIAMSETEGESTQRGKTGSYVF